MASRTAHVVSYLGRHIEVAFPLALLFSLACLGWGALADKVGVANAALIWVPSSIGALSAMIAMIFVGYLVFGRSDLLRRVRIVHGDRVAVLRGETALRCTQDPGHQ